MMESGVAFILAFSLIPPIILKSKSIQIVAVTRIATHHCFRVLLASTRNRGSCPCPRCLIPIDRIQNLGMPHDRQQRLALQRVDDERRQFLIANARRLIYEKNYAVDSKSLNKLLAEESLVPTSVSF